MSFNESLWVLAPADEEPFPFVVDEIDSDGMPLRHARRRFQTEPEALQMAQWIVSMGGRADVTKDVYFSKKRIDDGAET